MEKQVKGRDIAAPLEEIVIDGYHYELVFNNRAARYAEDVYENQYGKDVGYADILRGIAKGKYSAIMAIFYGAMKAGGCPLSWDEFDEKFKLDEITGLDTIIMRGVEKSLPNVPEGERQDP